MPNKKAKGKRAKQRDKMKGKGKPTVNKLLEEFDEEDIVQISINSAIHSGLPHHRFQGKTGRVERRRGSCYIVSLKDGNMRKRVIVHPVHLKKLVIKEAN
ncbi:MAG: 50S ribosomal protein L21e [archaeon]